MQPRQTFVALLASIAVFYIALFAISKFSPPAAPPGPHPGAQTTAPSSDQATTQPSTTAPSATAPATAGTGPAGVVTQPSGSFQFTAQDASRELVELGGAEADSPYPMLLKIDPVGAQVAGAWIRGHYETVKKDEPYHILATPKAVMGAGSFATPEIRFDDRRQNVSLADRVWSLDPASTETRKIWTLQINDAQGHPLALIEKTYELSPQKADKRNVSTYDLKLSVQVKNLSPSPARLILTQRGSVGLPQEDPRSEDRMIVSAFRQDGELTFGKHWRKDIAKANGTLPLGKDEGTSRLAWVAEANKYFACIMAPAGRTDGNGSTLFSSVEAITLSPTDPIPHTPSDMTYRFVTAPLEVAPGGTAGMSFDCYVGPKSKLAFTTVPAYEARDYYAVIREGFYACAPAGLTAVMMWLLNQFHAIWPHNYGIAIIMLVLVVRAILHPITKRSQVNMMKMQKQMSRLQPKIEAAKQRYAGDRMAMNQAIMEIYKQEGINPAGNLLSCLPLMLQIPIWGALWQALSSTIEMRHAPFDGWWIRDLAGPDALISFGRDINIPIISTFLTGPIGAFNLLPILLGISQLLQMKFMPRGTSPGDGPPTGPAAQQMEQQRKMMMYMSVFFVLMLYNAPSGLNLYIMASNLFGILEQWRIRKHLAELDAKAAKEPPPGAGPGGGPGKRSGPPAPPKKPSWLQRKWEELQKQAEEARKIQSQRPRK
ncbi:MAG TPA: YidC/Oxa1 family insertase periplasmic-domain containing protein [Phycisphaerae bacterium]|jgi:YidC/Oxa1 family membrane protein insertase|nr:membrane protein insertase YidC [Phycisphaerae bacterium]HOB75146.1 YidC/Oxa1 family insertase periplasmic-domain containing protein [Phycisphaerae bacterium]HOJ54632.1 YidC/Oxa1 family insertase periplasmic-domain containing protein [Phycisphaerae bacterium]HOL27258.1 YidC/Oxa1 family insertase periplasmic-domain containing protein [Phycisphaerae bacterium]HPP21058.1 YidC/Oxa1 family insertase periplasmic-domain containing protein [Phycisphaerae bacterium]